MINYQVNKNDGEDLKLYCLGFSTLPFTMSYVSSGKACLSVCTLRLSFTPPERSSLLSSSPPSQLVAGGTPSPPAASSQPPPSSSSLPLAAVCVPGSLAPAVQKKHKNLETCSILLHDSIMYFSTTCKRLQVLNSPWTRGVWPSPDEPPSAASPSLRFSAHPFRLHCVTAEHGYLLLFNLNRLLTSAEWQSNFGHDK